MHPRLLLNYLADAVLAVLVGIVITGCAQNSITNETLAATAIRSGSGDSAGVVNNASPADLDRLARIYDERTKGGPITDYPIGKGDVLEISVPAIDTMRDRITRVSTDGTISLPMLGDIQASGLTENALRKQITDRLAKYMYTPQVELFVKQYESRIIPDNCSHPVSEMCMLDVNVEQVLAAAQRIVREGWLEQPGNPAQVAATG